MTTKIRTAAGIAAAALILASCGGGKGPTVSTGPTLDYSQTASPHSYAAPQSGSHIVAYEGEGAEHVTIGGDMEPRENLRHVLTENGIRYYIGAVRDGVGVSQLENYETDLQTQNGDDPTGSDGDGFYPFETAPVLYIDEDFYLTENAGIASALSAALHIVNDALPPEFHMRLAAEGSTAPGITISLESTADIDTNCGSGAVACAVSTLAGGYTTAATLRIPDDLDTSEYTFPRKVIVHELLHALGIQGHVDSIEFPDSILGTSGEYIPNLGHVISRIDREVLQIMYMSQRTGAYNDWGEWSDVSHHLLGRSEDDGLHFGVALFNGLPQPWVRGGLPETDLADNASLAGTATWEGSLLGFSGPSPIAGDAELEVDLSTVANDDNEQELRFRDIYYVNRFETTDRTDSSDLWFPTRDIDYTVTVAGNYFENTDGEGVVTGAFLGAGHEHMGGTVKRTDMIGAFGGSRE